MTIFLKTGTLLLMIGTVAMAEDPAGSAAQFDPELRTYLQSRAAEFDAIPEPRKQELRKLTDYVRGRAAACQPARLTFICTHNSRRSQMAQIWAHAAARYFEIEGVETFSGGTESTAFNPRAVAAIVRTGVRIEKLDETENPHYAVRFGNRGEPLVCFSKVYNQPPNPGDDFCAVMTCSDADADCPVIPGCELRVAIAYEDPRITDGTSDEAPTYDGRCRQICREMLYLFSQL